MGYKDADRWLSDFNSKANDSVAVAVNYISDNMNAPQLSVKGCNNIASEMKAIARRFGVPIHHSKELTERLSKLEVLSEIPPDLYDDISRIFLSLEGPNYKKYPLKRNR